MSRSRQIAINAVSQSGATILNAALGVVLVPFLIRRLGKDGYGLIAVIIAISGLCALADLGIAGALSRQLAEALTRKDNRRYRELLSTATGLHLAMGSACALALFLFASHVAKMFALPSSLFNSGVFLLKTYGAVRVTCTFLAPSPQAVLASHNRFDTSSQIDAVRTLIQTAGLFIVLANTSAGIAGWAVVCVTTDGVCTFLLWRAAIKTNTGSAVALSAIRLSSVKDLLSLGSQFTLLQLSSQLSVNADPFILTACLGPASVSLYRPPGQVLGTVSPLILTLGNQLHPLATKAHVEGNRDDIAAILFRGTKYTMLMGAVFCAIALVLAYPLCRIWLHSALGEQYRICANVLMIQSITQLCTYAGGTQWPVLLGMRRTAFVAYSRTALAIINITSSWLLVRHTTLGVLGVVFPTMVIELIWRPVVVYYVCRVLDLAMWEYVKQSYLPPLSIAAVVGALGFAATWFMPPSQVGSLGAISGVLAIVAALLIWFLGLNSQDRAGVLRLFRLRLLRDSIGTAPFVARSANSGTQRRKTGTTQIGTDSKRSIT
jgi:O-antigen/teichoic acid export membrane protein